MTTFFETAEEFAAWLQKHGGKETQLIVGYYKRSTNRETMTWAESVDAALCFGWIDGVRKRIDERSYQIRFTPRKPRSVWSTINIERVRVLRSQGQMREAGLQAFARRLEQKSRIYSYEQTNTAALEPGELARFRRSKAAWKFFQAQPPGYRKLILWRIVSAKRAATRETRLAALIKACEEGRRL